MVRTRPVLCRSPHAPLARASVGGNVSVGGSGGGLTHTVLWGAATVGSAVSFFHHLGRKEFPMGWLVATIASASNLAGG